MLEGLGVYQKTNQHTENIGDLQEITPGGIKTNDCIFDDFRVGRDKETLFYAQRTNFRSHFSLYSFLGSWNEVLPLGLFAPTFFFQVRNVSALLPSVFF